jgi:hypothetical protein
MHELKEQPEWFQKRAARIRRACVPEVLDAVSRGYISPSTVDKFYRRLPAEEQRARIAEVIAQKDREVSRCRLAVEVLQRHSETQTADLHQLQADLAGALCE